jgi:drug/metabolite transporter (DMT)-like permease
VTARTRSIGYLLAVASAATGAVRYNLAVFADLRGLSYVPFLAGALAVGVLCTGVHVHVRDGAQGFVPLQGRWRHALAYGLLMGWSALSHFLALRFMNETVMASLSQTNILFTIALAVWLLGERFTRAEWLAASLILLGVFLFRPWEEVRAQGFLILLSGVVAGALATVLAKRWVADTPPRVLMFWRNAIALVIVSACAFAAAPPRITLATALACVAAGVAGPYLHGLFFLQALERVDASKAALVSRVQPALVFLLSWAFLSRLPGPADLAAAALLLAGALALTRARPSS